MLAPGESRSAMEEGLMKHPPPFHSQSELLSGESDLAGRVAFVLAGLPEGPGGWARGGWYRGS